MARPMNPNRGLVDIDSCWQTHFYFFGISIVFGCALLSRLSCSFRTARTALDTSQMLDRTTVRWTQDLTGLGTPVMRESVKASFTKKIVSYATINSCECHQSIKTELDPRRLFSIRDRATTVMSKPDHIARQITTSPRNGPWVRLHAHPPTCSTTYYPIDSSHFRS